MQYIVIFTENVQMPNCVKFHEQQDLVNDLQLLQSNKHISAGQTMVYLGERIMMQFA